MFDRYLTLTEIHSYNNSHFVSTLVFLQFTTLHFLVVLLLVLVGGSIALATLALKSQNEKAGKFSFIAKILKSYISGWDG